MKKKKHNYKSVHKIFNEFNQILDTMKKAALNIL